jgi:hypothetical protein
MIGKIIPRASFLLSLALFALFATGEPAWSHCDSLDGPVVTDARAALVAQDVTGVLKWIPEESEGEVRGAFEQALAVRALGPAAMELADRHFFETLVRLHRQYEGAPFTGLKPIGAPVHPAIARADSALEGGDVDALARELASAVESSVRDLFSETLEARSKRDESLDAGRDFVNRYVSFVHYVKYLHDAVTGAHSHGHATTGE